MKYQRWNIGVASSLTDLMQGGKQMVVAKPEVNCFLADPFKIGNYIFCEEYEYERGKGRIVVYDHTPSNSIERVDVAIDVGHHMSYPNIFTYKGNWYMIPEEHEVKVLRILKCVKFPLMWTPQCTIIEGREIIDTNITQTDVDVFRINYTEKSKGQYTQLIRFDGNSVSLLTEPVVSNDGRNGGQAYGRFVKQHSVDNIYGKYITIEGDDCTIAIQPEVYGIEGAIATHHMNTCSASLTFDYAVWWER